MWRKKSGKEVIVKIPFDGCGGGNRNKNKKRQGKHKEGIGTKSIPDPTIPHYS